MSDYTYVRGFFSSEAHHADANFVMNNAWYDASTATIRSGFWSESC